MSDPDIRSISTNLILPTNARYLQYITATAGSLQVTVNSGQSVRVVNRGSTSFTVNMTGPSSQSLAGGDTAVVAWDPDTSAHTIQNIPAPGQGGSGYPMATPLDHGGVGDGVADDTAALQAAVDTGGCYLPRGYTWKITDKIDVDTDGIVIRGEGWGSKVVQVTAEKNAFNIPSGTDKVTIEGVEIVLQNQVPFVAFTNCNGIFCQTGTNITLRKNIISGYTACGIQFRGTINSVVEGNLIYGADTADTAGSSGDIVYYGTNKNFSIQNNICVSDVSQNIYAAALDGDERCVISGNICETLDGSWQPITTPTWKRWSIIANYSAAASSEPNKFVVSGNVCANTRWGGIYVQGKGRGVIIADNYCSNNCKVYQGSSLGGGIYVGSESESIQIIGNMVYNCDGDATQTGSIAIMGSVDTTRGHIVHGNLIVGGTVTGILIGLHANKASINDNVIVRPTNRGISIIASASTDSGDISIEGNTVFLNGDYRGVYLDPQGSTDWITVKNNKLIQEDSASGTRASNCGVYARQKRVAVKDNLIKGFKAGYFQEQYDNTRNLANEWIEGNIFESCDTGVVIRGTNNDGIQPIYNNRFRNCTNETHGDGAVDAAKKAIRRGNNITIFATSSPTTGLWAEGDICENTNAATNMIPYWYYTNSSWIPGGLLTTRVVTASDGDTTPTVKHANVIVHSHTSGTSVTNHDDGTAAQEITCVINSNTTLVHNVTKMKLAGAANITGAANGTQVQLQYVGGIWYQTGAKVDL